MSFPSSHLILSLVAVAALSACGGGDSASTTATTGTTQLSGAVVKGPVAGASVCAYAVAATARGAALGPCTVTDGTGQYTLSIPAVAGPVWLEATGGSYTDEATALAVSLAAGAALTSLIDANGGSVNAYLTPLTTIALNTARASGTLDLAAYNRAAAALLSAFGLSAGLDISHTAPVVTGTFNDYGNALRNISRMIAAGLSLAQILATTQPATLSAAYAAAAAGPVIPPPAPTPGGAARPIIISAATPASLDGLLDKLAGGVEHGSSNDVMTTYNLADGYCRVGAYGMKRGTDPKSYYIEISFRKGDHAIGLVKFGDDNGTAPALASRLGQTAAVSIDVVNRQISFANLALTGAATSLTLNGTLEYPTHYDPASRAACG